MDLSFLGVALIYFLLGDWLHTQLLQFLEDQGIQVYRRIEYVSSVFNKEQTVSTVKVVLTTLVALMKWTFSWGGVMHFNVGLSRVCGYKIDPYFNYPWLSTNLVTFWSRFTFHYREFLVRAFYYPVFFRFFKGRASAHLCSYNGRSLFWQSGLGPYDRGRILSRLRIQ